MDLFWFCYFLQVSKADLSIIRFNFQLDHLFIYLFISTPRHPNGMGCCKLVYIRGKSHRCTNPLLPLFICALYLLLRRYHWSWPRLCFIKSFPVSALAETGGECPVLTTRTLLCEFPLGWSLVASGLRVHWFLAHAVFLCVLSSAPLRVLASRCRCRRDRLGMSGLAHVCNEERPLGQFYLILAE